MNVSDFLLYMCDKWEKKYGQIDVVSSSSVGKDLLAYCLVMLWRPCGESH